MRSLIRSLIRFSSVAVAGCALVAAIVGSGAGISEPGIRARASVPSTVREAVSSTAVTAPSLYVDPNSPSAKEVAALTAAGALAEASKIREISSQPGAIWLTGSPSGAALTSYLQRYVTAARSVGAELVFVTYAIPNRDCGGYSAGGLTTSGYIAWNQTIASALAGTGSIVIVEPDALAMLSKTACSTVKSTRLPLLSQAVGILAGAGLKVYLDAGHSGWTSPSTMAPLLQKAGVAKATGFSTNVASFHSTSVEASYANQISALIGGKHYVIDVSRNGAGYQPTWCNPPGAALGQNPAFVSGQGGLDALLWIKSPGLSDGSCNGAPPAGQWYESYALTLLANRGY